MSIAILAVLLLLSILAVQPVIIPPEVLTYFQVPAWAFWLSVLGLLAWLLQD